MIITIKVKTKYPKSFPALLKHIQIWLKQHRSSARLMGWTAEEETGDETI